MVLERPEALSPEDLRTLRRRYVEQRRLEELQVLVNWRTTRGLKLPPLTCAVCNTKTFCGPLCFEHMDEGRSVSRMWVDYQDPDRRNVHKLEDFLVVQYAMHHPASRTQNRMTVRQLQLYESLTGEP